MGDLLCAELKLSIRNRHTRQIVCDITAPDQGGLTGRWTRQHRAKSTAEVTIDTRTGCCPCQPTPWVDELWIERNGQTVWFGPIVTTEDDRLANEYTIEACDRSAWWERIQTFTRTHNVTDDTARLWALIRGDQNRYGNPAGFTIRPGTTGRATTLDVAANQDLTETAIADLDDVAWTVVAGQLYGPDATTVGELPFATLDAETDWGDRDGTTGPVIIRDGTTTATFIIALGANGIVATWPKEPPTDAAQGVHIPAPVEAEWITSQIALERYARQVWERNVTGNTFLSTSQATLWEGSDLCVEDLIPGRRFTLTSQQCFDPRPLRETVELERLVVEFGWQVEGGQAAIREQRVAVDLAPLGQEWNQDRISL